MIANRDNKSAQKQKTLHCSYLDGDYHSVENCYYLQGFPVGHKLHGKKVKPPNQRHVNNTKTEATKAPADNVPKFTTEEYNQLTAIIHQTMMVTHNIFQIPQVPSHIYLNSSQNLLTQTYIGSLIVELQIM